MVAEVVAEMVVEVAQLAVTPGSEQAFAAAYRDAVPLLLQTSGCRSARLLRGVEFPSAFVLLVEWDSVEHHHAATATASRGGAR